MTLRARRLMAALALLIGLLFVARWAVFFVAERWWAASISPAAASFVTSWQLLGLALDACAILSASIWFAIQALVVARAIASVQVTHRFGDLQLREAVPMRLLLGGAAAAGIVLGLLTGAGAHAWREPLALAWQGVRYGVTDPLLHQDLGVYVAQLPAWDLIHRFAILLALLGVAFCAALYSAIGALRREHRTIVIHLDARRHLGVLLAFVAVVIAVGYLLEPYHLAAAAPPSLLPDDALTRVHAAQVMAGVAAATAALSLVWALRGRNTLLAASWIVLGIGAFTERFVIPALSEEVPPTGVRAATARQFDAMAWGIHQPSPSVPADSMPSVTALWDEAMLSQMVERSGLLEAATPGVVEMGGHAMPAWLVATSRAGQAERLDVLAVADGITAAGGAPLLLRSAEESHAPEPVWRTVTDARATPMAPSWRAVNSGVASGGLLRRVLLAWARQAPGMLADAPEPALDWHLDPVERAAAVLPMLTWLPAEVMIVNSRPTWLTQGMLAIDQFPLATHARWGNNRVAGVNPAVLCTVDAASGETRFYMDPGADSLGAAWVRLIGPLISPAAALPPDVRHGATYPAEWLEAQLAVLQGPLWNAGREPQQLSVPLALAPVWVTPGIPGRQMILEDPQHGSIATVATAYRADGVPQLRLEHRESDGTAVGARSALRQLWGRAPAAMHLRDSVLAAGDTVTLRNIRWYLRGDGAAAWQPLFALPRGGVPVLLWISTALDDRIGGGRAPSQAWAAAVQPGAAASDQPPDDATVLQAARASLRRADSAFRRGDLTAFGRAFEELRGILQPPRH